MLAVFVCLVGILLILLTAEFLWRNKLLRGEYQRKFVHILSAGFIASWPWLVSFRTIQLIGLAMIAVVLVNRRVKTFHYLEKRRHWDYGDFLLAIAVVICALLTHNKVFFATAMVEVALADGLAALIGNEFIHKWHYRVFGQSKTLIGSMAFWLISLAILGTGMLFAHNVIPLNHYAWLLAVLPPILTLIESVSIFGLDNLAVPIAVILALQIAKVG